MEYFTSYYKGNREAERNSDPPIARFDRPCDSCRQRKIKCDYLRPCFQCKSRNLSCQYTALPSKRKRMRSVDLNHESQTDPQKLVDYTIQHEGDIEKVSPAVTVAARTCSMGKGFCTDVSQVVRATTGAFYRLMKPLMPRTTTEYQVEYSTMLYHRLFTTKPDEITATSSMVNFETTQQLLTHSSIFAIGSKLIRLDVKALHFHRAALSILDLPALQNSFNTDPEPTKHLILSLLYNIIYLILKKSYDQIFPLWQRAAELLRQHETALDEQTVEELTYWLIILAPAESHKYSNFWIRKLESIQSDNISIDIALFKEIARIMAFFSQLPKPLSHEDNQTLNQLWKYANDAETILSQFFGSANYPFYGVLVFGLKAITAINMPNNMEEEVDRCAHLVEQLFSSIVEPVERMWLKLHFEYLQFTFSNLQRETEDLCTYDLTLGTLEV